MPNYPYIYRWGPIWREIPGAHDWKGLFCRVLARGRMNRAHVEFENGETAFISRNALARRKA